MPMGPWVEIVRVCPHVALRFTRPSLDMFVAVAIRARQGRRISAGSGC